METTEAKRCKARTEMYSLGRGVAEYRQCKVRTRHPSGLCHHHRSDDSDGSQRGVMVMGSDR